MTEFELPDAALEPVTLAVDRRTTLGASQDPPDKQTDRISLGRPTCKQLTLETVDAEAKSFLEQNPASSYWLLSLICSFRAVEDAPIEQAWLEVVLSTVLETEAEEPTAWSMEPLTLNDPVKISSVVKLDSSLKLRSPVVPLDGGGGASRQTTTDYEKRIPYVEAYREGTANPSWWFSRSTVTEVRGVHRLRTVVEVPRGVGTRAVVKAGATLKLKLLGLVTYRTPLDDPPEERSIVFAQGAGT